MKYFKRIDFLFSLTSLFILTIGFIFLRGQSTLDINFHDTYFVIAHHHIALGLSICFAFISLIYFIFTKYLHPLNYRLGQIHFVITILAIAILVFTPNYLNLTRYTVESEPWNNGLDINQFIMFALLVLLLGQIIFLANIIGTILGRKKTTP